MLACSCAFWDNCERRFLPYEEIVFVDAGLRAGGSFKVISKQWREFEIVTLRLTWQLLSDACSVLGSSVISRCLIIAVRLRG
jgi:hypothetical protein